MADTDRQVLIVDSDHLASLISKMLVGKYSTDVATDGLKAVSKLRELLPDLLVVDVDIPGSGVKLTELVGISPKYQAVPVILMSGKTTTDMVVRAQNAGASSYLAKPFGPTELHDRIDQVLQSFTYDTGSEDMEGSDSDSPQTDSDDETGPDESEESAGSIQSRVKKIENLPTFPATHAEILKLAESDTSSSEDIADKMKLDPTLLATIFKLVNSSKYGFAKKVSSLKLAITILGLEEIANLVMAAQVFEKMGDYENGAGLDLHEFWKHSVGTGFVARAIANKLHTETESAFLGGMMHDLEKVVLDRFFADYYGSVFDLIESENKTISQAEHDILGLSHADIGGCLATEWSFSENFLNAILYHHDPEKPKRYQRLVCLVHLADTICREMDYGSGGDAVPREISPFVLDHFSLGEKGLKILREEAKAELDHADSFLSALKS